MTKKADFNAEEWSTLVEAPLLAGMRLVKASRGGTIRESMALGKAYGAAREKHGENELLDAIVASPPAIDKQKLGESGNLPQAVKDRLGEAVRLLEEKATPEDVDAYKHFVLSAAEVVANAHKEGGFLGIGGKRISDGEKAALNELADTLGLWTSSEG